MFSFQVYFNNHFKSLPVMPTIISGLNSNVNILCMRLYSVSYKWHDCSYGYPRIL